jgi:hypothetical protein
MHVFIRQQLIHRGCSIVVNSSERRRIHMTVLHERWLSRRGGHFSISSTNTQSLSGPWMDLRKGVMIVRQTLAFLLVINGQ